jgi:hypothetical protein
MQHDFLHVFRLTVDGLTEPAEFEMLHESEDVADVTDAFAKYVVRQEDDFLPIGTAAAIRANRVVRIEHVRVEKR